MSQSQKMRMALSKYVIPKLTEKGFSGKYPHYKKIYEDRIELLVFETNSWGNSFTVEISTVFLPQSKRDSNFCSSDFETIENATVWDTDLRYRLRGLYNGWFYYTDVYKQKINSITFYKLSVRPKLKITFPKKMKCLFKKQMKLFITKCVKK